MTLTYNHKPEAYKKLSHFKDKKDFNDNVEKWLADWKDEFGKRELWAFKTLARYSVRLTGVATLKINTLVKAGKEIYGFIFSVRTAKRMIKKAVEIGIFKTHDTKHTKTGLKGPNIYEWMRYVFKIKDGTTYKKVKKWKTKSDKGCQKKEMALHKTTSIQSNIINNINTYTASYVDSSSSTKREEPKERNQSFYSKVINILSDYNQLHDVKEISRVIYGNINKFSRIPLYKDYRPKIESIAIDSLRYVLYHADKFKSIKGMLHKLICDGLNGLSITLIKEAEEELDNVKPTRGEINSLNERFYNAMLIQRGLIHS